MEDLKLATSAIVLIIFLVIPGISFKSGYYSRRFKGINSGSFQDRLVTTVFISILFQIFIIFLNNYLFDDKIDSETYTKLLSQELFTKNNNIDLNPKNLVYALKYLLFCSIFPFIVGFLLNKIICFFRLDLGISYFRSNDSWYYYFNGNIPNDEKRSFKKLKVISTYVDVLVETSTENKLYSGLYVTHILKKNNAELDYLILKDVLRFSYGKNKFVVVPGNFFKINGEKIINTNTRHIIKEITNKSNKIDPLGIIVILLLLESVASVVIPFYLNTNLLITILNIVLLLLLSLFFSTLLHKIFVNREKADRKSTVITLIVIILLIVSGFYALN